MHVPVIHSWRIHLDVSPACCVFPTWCRTDTCTYTCGCHEGVLASQTLEASLSSVYHTTQEQHGLPVNFLQTHTHTVRGDWRRGTTQPLNSGLMSLMFHLCPLIHTWWNLYHQLPYAHGMLTLDSSLASSISTCPRSYRNKTPSDSNRPADRQNERPTRIYLEPDTSVKLV